MKKNVIISMRAVPSANSSEVRDCIDQKLVSYFEELGYLPFLMPNFQDVKRVEQFVKEVDPSLIVLSGGNNIAPSLYGSHRSDVGDISLVRDAAEKKLLDIAVKQKIKVFGICRGVQMINVYFGGKLIHIKNELNPSVNHVATTHQIVLNNTAKAGLVNSYHDYGFTVKDLAQGLMPVAQSEDKIVEMIKHQELPIQGVMWHPERSLGDKDFEWSLLKDFLTT